MTTITVNTPAPISAPRGAVLAANIFAKLLGGLSAMAAGRASRQLQAQRVAEANEVRQLAQDVMAQDRRFAADLLAAADRHELG